MEELLSIAEVFVMLTGFIWLFAMARASAKEDKHIRDLVKKEETDHDG